MSCDNAGIFVKTDRLILRPVRMDDAPFVQKEFAHWDIIKQMVASVPWPYPDDGAVTHLNKCLPEVAAGTMCLALITLHDGTPLGMIHYRTTDEESIWKRGFWLAIPHQGNGYMTEAATAMNGYMFQHRGAKAILADNFATNLESRRVKEKQGFEFLGCFKDAPGHRREEGDTYSDRWILTRKRWEELSA